MGCHDELQHILFHSNLQTDLEETKAQEIAKLQDMLHEMQLQVEQAKSTVIKEREAARKTIEEALPIIKETPVLVQDTEKIDLLNAETENLKVRPTEQLMLDFYFYRQLNSSES